jgi:protein-L-isoaspartate(D-aspartate) O-methyltransferase
MVERALHVLLLSLLVGCGSSAQSTPAELRARRIEMVDAHIRQRGVVDPRVLDAVRTVPRERFVPPELASRAYEDNPLPIGYGQTISQPYVVAYMTEVLGVGPGHKVLEIGTGSGYQAAVLSRLGREVFTVEIIPQLARGASAVLRDEGYTNVHVREGDGYGGWPEHAPFDRIMVTAAPDEVPGPLLDQLAVGGRLVIPIGPMGGVQYVTVIEKTEKGNVERRMLPVQFVPFTRSR